MAILGAERAVGGLLYTLQQHIATQIGYINLERGDSTTLPAIGAWEKGRPDKMYGDETQVNIWCERSTHDAWDANAVTNWTYVVNSTVNSEHECVILLRHTNRGMMTRRQMDDRSDRYAVAILRVLLRNQDAILTPGTAYIRLGEITRGQEIEEEQRRITDSVQATVFVMLAEDSVGEGAAGQGQPPAFYVQIRS